MQRDNRTDKDIRDSQRCERCGDQDAWTTCGDCEERICLDCIKYADHEDSFCRGCISQQLLWENHFSG